MFASSCVKLLQAMATFELTASSHSYILIMKSTPGDDASWTSPLAVGHHDPRCTCCAWIDELLAPRAPDIWLRCWGCPVARGDAGNSFKDVEESEVSAELKLSPAAAVVGCLFLYAAMV
jgi:hypothetical protein